MRHILTLTTLLTAVAAAVTLPLAAQATPVDAPAAVANYTVFVDAPTGFVFVKLPQGWKFAGKADGATPSVLPPNVVTRLLPADADTSSNLVAKQAPAAKL